MAVPDMRIAHQVDDAVVAGGGPAGAAVAISLARAGRQVTVIERDAAPAHRVCGEFIGADALARLASLGVDPLSLGAQPIHRLRLLRGTHLIETALPFAAAGLSRRALDAALLTAAQASGATVLRGHKIRRVNGTVLEVERLGRISARSLFLATGKHELRGAERRTPRGCDSVGIKLHLRLSPAQTGALRGAIELLLIGDAYVGLQLIEDGIANLCLVAPASLLRKAGDCNALLAALCRGSSPLASRLAGAQGWPKPLAVARTPYGFIHRPSAADAAFRLGDQMGVIASFAGDGIAVALHTAALAADCALKDESARNYHARARAELQRPIRVASTLNRALSWTPGRAALLGAARLWPGMIRHLALLTRIG